MELRNLSENRKLKESLILYKEITLKLIGCLEKEDYDCLEGLLKEREDQISNMGQMSYTKEEFRDICNQLQILILQQRLNGIMNEKRAKVRTEIDRIATTKNASKNYNKGFKVDSIFFNKKI